LGRYLTTVDVELFAISSATGEADLILRKQEMQHVDIVSVSQEAIAAIDGATLRIPPLVGDIVSQSKQMRSKGCTSKLVQVLEEEDIEGLSAARNATTRAVRRQPRQLRSTSLTYMQQSVRETKPTVAKINKYHGDSRKSTTARYVQSEVGTHCDGRTPLEKEESKRQPMLVVRQQRTQREPPHVQMSQMEKTT